MGYHTAIRGLSFGKVLKRVSGIKLEIKFHPKKGKAALTFAVDGMALLNAECNMTRHGLFAHEMHNLEKDAEAESADPCTGHISMWHALQSLQGAGRFQRNQWKVVLIGSPLTCDLDKAACHVQLIELIDLQSDVLLANHFKSTPLRAFY